MGCHALNQRCILSCFFFFQAEDGIRDYKVTGAQTCALPISTHSIELGWQGRTQHLTFSPSVYYRYKTDAFTRVTRALNDSTFLRTMANLESDRSAGQIGRASCRERV